MDYKCIIGNRQQHISDLLEYMRLKKYVVDPSVSICVPKNKTNLTANRQIGEIYDLYHDRDDKMLYLQVLTSNPFG